MTSAAIMRLLPASKYKISRPSPLQRGIRPPLVDTGHLLFGTGNDATYTSCRPDSFDVYATQRPSGENCAPTPSVNSVVRYGRRLAISGHRHDPQILLPVSTPGAVDDVQQKPTIRRPALGVPVPVIPDQQFFRAGATSRFDIEIRAIRHRGSS